MNKKTCFLFSWLSSFSLLFLVMSEMLRHFQKRGWEAQGRLYFMGMNKEYSEPPRPSEVE